MCNVKEKSPIWQSFKILLMPDRCLLLLNSRVALSRSKSIKNIQQLFSCFVVRSWIQLLYPPSRNLQFMALEDHLRGAKCFLLRSILYYFYFCNKELVITYFEIVLVKKVHKFVCIDLVAC